MDLVVSKDNIKTAPIIKQAVIVEVVDISIYLNTIEIWTE